MGGGVTVVVGVVIPTVRKHCVQRITIRRRLSVVVGVEEEDTGRVESVE